MSVAEPTVAGVSGGTPGSGKTIVALGYEARPGYSATPVSAIMEVLPRVAGVGVTGTPSLLPTTEALTRPLRLAEESLQAALTGQRSPLGAEGRHPC